MSNDNVSEIPPVHRTVQTQCGDLGSPDGAHQLIESVPLGWLHGIDCSDETLVLGEAIEHRHAVDGDTLLLMADRP